MSILTPNSFNGGEQNIADISNDGVQENLQVFIDKYEVRFLKELLGVSLANEFIAGLAVDPIEQKWIDLRDDTDLKEMLKCYVFYWYINYQITLTSGTGEVKPSNENSNVASAYPKMVLSWNEMVKMIRLFDLSTETYPDYLRPYWRRYDRWFEGCEINEIFYYKNRYGL